VGSLLLLGALISALGGAMGTAVDESLYSRQLYVMGEAARVQHVAHFPREATWILTTPRFNQASPPSNGLRRPTC
jgi:hypothetical protein